MNTQDKITGKTMKNTEGSGHRVFKRTVKEKSINPKIDKERFI